MDKAVIAAETIAQLIRKIDMGDVVAAAGRDGEVRRDVERIGDENAEILVNGVDANGRRIALIDRGSRVLRREDEQLGREHEQRRVEQADLRTREEARRGIVEGSTQRAMILVP